VSEPKEADPTIARAIDEAAQDWFLRLNDPDMPPAEQQRFEEWRAADPRHRAAYEEVRAMWADIDALEPAFAPARHAPGPAARPRRVFWSRPRLALAAALAVCLLVFVLMPSASHLPTRLLADYSTGTGSQRAVALPDGSVAILNTDSAIDVDYGGERRIVKLLYGEAHFEVAKDAQRPFQVLAVGGRTTAVGTAFAVRDSDGAATVTVTQGIVSVESPDSSGALVEGQGGTRVAAGQQVRYRRGARPDPVQGVDAPAVVAWRQGAIVIRDRSLAEALAEIGRYRAGRIVLLGDASRYELVTARLALADLDAGIDALAATHGLSVTRVTGYLMIVR
jgi:transmembrane sensor